MNRLVGTNLVPMFCVTLKKNYEHASIVIEIGCYFFFFRKQKNVLLC